MSKMLRKKLIPAEFVVASSLLLAPGFTLTGFGQNSPQTSTPTSPRSGRYSTCRLCLPLLRHRRHRVRKCPGSRQGASTT